MWEADWSKFESQLPDRAINNKPVLIEGLEFYLTAFCELQSERPVGMTVGQIPWSSIINWCDFHGLKDSDDVDTLIRYVRAMENALIKHFDEKKKEKQKNDQ